MDFAVGRVDFRLIGVDGRAENMRKKPRQCFFIVTSWFSSQQVKFRVTRPDGQVEILEKYLKYRNIFPYVVVIALCGRSNLWKLIFLIWASSIWGYSSEWTISGEFLRFTSDRFLFCSSNTSTTLLLTVRQITIATFWFWSQFSGGSTIQV